MQSRAAELLIMIALAAISDVACAQAPDTTHDDPPPTLTPDRVYALDASMERVLQDFALPGLAIGIVEDGQPVYMRGFGVRDTRTDEPVNAHTLFHVESITRTLTATAVMQLAERGQLGLSDSLADSPVTVTQLLTREDSAFDALGAIIETASQQKYLQYMQTRVLNAAGMGESTFGVPITGTNVAWPHTGTVFVRRAQRYPWDEDTMPSVGLSASIADLTRWAAVQVSHDPALLAANSYGELIKHQRDLGRDGLAMALGWQLERRGDDWLPRQAAKGRGFSALLTLYPSQQRAIVILSNGETLPGKEIRNVIESVLAGEAWLPPQPSLLLRTDFQWSLGGLLAMSLLLFAVSVHYRRRRLPA
ncbi:serine hydrolase domain-containing protein [Steroidobacter sp.]|uniref:serine hydrolase domain-containing protein n=1 Tax=Steroidobacter sp. TaxID=1978227 RepID=UPI001A5177D5|nr:serine hydrolase domain-containing protein [Steroidobacter sp.]MBL8265785.1 beta-lactamase family protein [Steroidobacter sp.]